MADDEPGTKPESNHAYEIEARDLCYSILVPKPGAGGCWRWRRRSCYERRQVLSNINCKASPGRLLAIAGPSGAGKSTLLELLAGKLTPSSPPASLLLNGQPIAAAGFLGKLSAYVAQHDALLPLLTVRETVAYSAALRLAGPAAAERQRRIESLIQELGLGPAAAAGTFVKDLSGGQRRRVSIAVEIVHDPAVVFLDEPTSGLDSSAASQIMRSIKRISAKNKTVVLSIHQPGTRILDLIDDLLLISGGSVLHFGTVDGLRRAVLKGRRDDFPSALDLQHINTLDIALDNLSLLRLKVTLHDLFNAHKPPHLSYADSAFRDDEGGAATWWGTEVAVLTRRGLVHAWRRRGLFVGRTLQAAVAGLWLGSIFRECRGPQERMGMIAFTLTFLMSATTEGLPVFVQELPVLLRETYAGAYRMSAHVAATAAVFSAVQAAVAVAFSVPAYFLAGLRRDAGAFGYFVLVMWTALYAANSVVVAVSAAVADYVLATTLGMGLMGCFFLFSGFFVLKSDIPWYWMFVHYASLFKYPLEALLINEYGGNGGLCVEEVMGVCVLDVQGMMHQQGLRANCRLVNVLVMLAFVVFYRILSYFFLRLRCARRHPCSSSSLPLSSSSSSAACFRCFS